MSYIGKTTVNGSGQGTINTDVVFNGKVYQANNNYFNLQYGDSTSLASIIPSWTQGYSNTAIGMNTCPSLTSGYSNTVVGSYAMNKNTTGYQNTALGSAAIYNNIGGIFNVAVGNDAMLQSYNGSYNTAVGKGCMFGGGGTPSNLTFSSNTGVGNSTLISLTSGNDNVAVGKGAGNAIETGSRNTFLGTNANAGSYNFNQSTAIGYGATTTASNQIMLGTASETVLIPNSITTQGLYYEVINTATQSSTNAPTLSYSVGGNFVLGTLITANCTLGVTNIPTDTTKAYTFSVTYQQTSTRFYIATVQFQDTGSAYITNSGSAGFVAPYFNGGTPSLTGITNCVIIQTFTIISAGGSRRVLSSVSCCSL